MTKSLLFSGLIPCVLAIACASAMGGNQPIVLVVGTDSITVHASDKAGAKITDIDSSGSRTVEAPNNVVIYQVPSNARIEVDHLPGKLSDVQPGMTVDVTQGMDRASAYSIVANTVPPPAPASKQKGHALTSGVRPNVVIAITSDRIIYGMPGTARAHAAIITPTTLIYLGSEKIPAADIPAARAVDVITVDGIHACKINVHDTNN